MTSRPLTESGIAAMRQWLAKETWISLYSTQDVDEKAEMLQKVLLLKLD